MVLRLFRSGASGASGSAMGGAKTIGLIGSLAVLLNNILGPLGSSEPEAPWGLWRLPSEARDRQLLEPLPAEWLVAPDFPGADLCCFQHLQRGLSARPQSLNRPFRAVSPALEAMLLAAMRAYPNNQDVRDPVYCNAVHFCRSMWSRCIKSYCEGVSKDAYMSEKTKWLRNRQDFDVRVEYGTLCRHYFNSRVAKLFQG